MSKEAREVLNSTESLELDLKGFTYNQAKEFVESAFEDDRTLEEMIRVTLIVGAGKEKRQKYDQDLAKWVRQGLKEIGYEENNGASCAFACQGTFKYQHDTGKNLMYVHVFPRAIQNHKKSENDDENENAKGGELFTDDGGHGSYNAAEWLCIVSSLDTFRKMIQKKMPAWLQKRRCMQMLKGCIEKVAEGERKMMAMKAMDEDEQKLYTEAVDLADKVKFLTEEMKKMVETGKLTSKEKEIVLAQIAEKMEIVKAELEGDSVTDKKKEKLQRQETALKNRKEKISSIKPYKLSLNGEAEIKILYKKLIPLDKLEKKAGAKGLWSSKLTTLEVAALKGKEELDEQLNILLGAARCWFEDGDEFQERLNEVRNVISTRIERKTEAKSKAVPNDGWSTIKTTKTKKTDFSKLLKKKPNTGGFNALMD